MRRSFALRLAAAFGGVGIAAAAITALLVNVVFPARFSTYLSEQQRVRAAQVVASLAESYRRTGGWASADVRSIGDLLIMEGGTLRLVDVNGNTIWDSSAGDGDQMAAMHREMMGGGPLGAPERLPIRVGDRVVGTAVVRLPQPGLLPQDEAFRSSVNRLLLLGGALAGIVALALGWILAKRATAPARQLTEAARILAAGDRSKRLDLEAEDEFGEMAQAFNAMVDTIEEEERLRKAFAADVAHELRTPLTILRTQIEAMQDGVIEPTPPALASLHEEVLRLQRLVADLESLASAEAAGFSLERQPVDVRPLLERAAEEFAGPYEAAQIRLRTDLTDVSIEADATRVRQVVINLLSNALKFTPAGGEVRVELRAVGAEAQIRVSDTGPGIAPEDLPHIFDRFYRGRGVRAGGSGIGLTVARELVRAHGGELEVESTPGVGTTFTVRLPGASPRPRTSFTAPSQGAATVGATEGVVR